MQKYKKGKAEQYAYYNSSFGSHAPGTAHRIPVKVADTYSFILDCVYICRNTDET